MHPINFIFLCSGETCCTTAITPVHQHQCSLPAPPAMGQTGAAALRSSRNLLLVPSSATQSLLTGAGADTTCFSSVFKDRRKFTAVFTAATGVPVHYSSRLLEGPFAFHMEHLWQYWQLWPAPKWVEVSVLLSKRLLLKSQARRTERFKTSCKAKKVVKLYYVFINITLF